MAAIPGERSTTTVLTKQLAVGRYATALLVRLRRLKRHGTAGSGGIDDDDDSATTTARIDPAWRARRILARRSTLATTVPDRSLTAEEPLPTMAIRAAGTHQFVYRKMLDGPVGAAAPNHGDLVRVVDRARRAPRLRALERPLADQPEVPVAAEQRLPDRNSGAAASSDAVALRTKVLDLERETNAYRVVHAEGDGLSGLIVDRFDDVLSVEVFSLGIYQRIGPILSLCAESAGDEAFSSRRRRAGGACRRISRAGRSPARGCRRA